MYSSLQNLCFFCSADSQKNEKHTHTHTHTHKQTHRHTHKHTLQYVPSTPDAHKYCDTSNKYPFLLHTLFLTEKLNKCPSSGYSPFWMKDWKRKYNK